MNDKPLISIVIPVYNVEVYLEQCVKSIINQSFTDYEILLINDGSTDNSGSLCDKLKKECDYITVFHQANAGVGAARNKGIINASGKYIYFLDSDDFVSDDFFEKLLPFLNKDFDVLQFGFSRVNIKGGFLNNQIPKLNKEITDLQKDRDALIDIFDSGVGMALWDKIINLELLTVNNLLVDNKKRGEDIAFNIDLFSVSKKVLILSNSLVNYRIVMGTGTKSDSYIVENHIDNFIKIKSYFDGLSSYKVKDFLLKLFDRWFFVVIPLNIAVLNKKEQKRVVDLLFDNNFIRLYLKENNLKLNLYQKLMINSILNRKYFVYLSVGNILLKIRKIKYS
ncbi:glycosyltransferase [Empedobacter falsenii]